MSATTTESMTTVASAQQALFKALTAHRQNPVVMQRIQALVVQRTGHKLQDFCNNGATDEEKLTLLGELQGIVDKQEWDKLPAAAGAQASAPTPPPAKPAPAKPAVKAAAPAVVPPPAQAPSPLPATLSPMAAALLTEIMPHLRAEFTKLIPPQPEAKADVSADEVRAAVRGELATVFEKIAGVLRQ